jgi:hypothetical protein
MMSILILYCHILLWESKIFKAFMVSSKRKRKQSRYTPWRRLGGEEVELLRINDLGIIWGCKVSSRPTIIAIVSQLKSFNYLKS